MKEYLSYICNELEFPTEAAEAMQAAWQAVEACTAAREIFGKYIAAYEADCHLTWKDFFTEIDQAAEAAGVHKYTAELLIFLLLTKQLKVYYEKAGIDEQIWHDSCMDLHWKLMECKKVHGIWGSFVAGWFPGFFILDRFALGRLQFELINFPAKYEESGRKKPEGMTKAINVHIPSCGKLKREDWEASYKKAAAFFGDAFEGDQVAFCCWSWLLFEKHEEFLGADSGIAAFAREYDVFNKGETNGDLWRIFDREYDGNPDGLPENTRLQRVYKKWLQGGNNAGFGEGIFFLKK